MNCFWETIIRAWWRAVHSERHFFGGMNKSIATASTVRTLLPVNCLFSFQSTCFMFFGCACFVCITSIKHNHLKRSSSHVHILHLHSHVRAYVHACVSLVGSNTLGLVRRDRRWHSRIQALNNWATHDGWEEWQRRWLMASTAPEHRRSKTNIPLPTRPESLCWGGNPEEDYGSSVAGALCSGKSCLI